MQSITQGEVTLFSQRLLGQRQLAGGILLSHLTHVMGSPPVGFGDHLDIGLPQQADQRANHLGLLFHIVNRRHRIVMPLHISHLHHQQRVVCGHGPTAFGKDMRMRQTLFFTELAQHQHHSAGVFLNVVVDRAGIARVGTVVIDPQPAAHIDMVNRQPQRPQLTEVTDRLAKAMLVIRQIGDLRTHVKVQQPHPGLQPGGPELLDHPQQLRRRQPELGLLATGIGPLTGCQRRQTHPQTHLWCEPQCGSFLNDQPDFGLLLDDNEHVMPELLPEQRQADELAILVAVADNGPALGGQRQYRHQLRLGARLQTNGDTLGGNDVLHHRLLLVDLDRVERGIAVVVIQLGNAAVEGAGQLTHPVLQNVRKA